MRLIGPPQSLSVQHETDQLADVRDTRAATDAIFESANTRSGWLDFDPPSFNEMAEFWAGGAVLGAAFGTVAGILTGATWPLAAVLLAPTYTVGLGVRNLAKKVAEHRGASCNEMVGAEELAGLEKTFQKATKFERVIIAQRAQRWLGHLEREQQILPGAQDKVEALIARADDIEGPERAAAVRFGGLDEHLFKNDGTLRALTVVDAEEIRCILAAGPPGYDPRAEAVRDLIFDDHGTPRTELYARAALPLYQTLHPASRRTVVGAMKALIGGPKPKQLQPIDPHRVAEVESFLAGLTPADRSEASAYLREVLFRNTDEPRTANGLKPS